jgi:uncharacterized protein YecT (DUF1311 family)
MKATLTSLLIFVATFGVAQTQLEMNQKANVEFQKADKELNSVYQKIIKEYSGDTLFIKNLRASQKIWIQFRDAEILVKYPETEPNYYGSIFPVCYSNYKTKLTQERITTLKQWIVGSKEGDVCGGSVKVK